MTFVDYNDGNRTWYDYDKLGNRTKMTCNTTNTIYDSNALNQYRTVGGTSYTYDKNGNLTSDSAYRYYYDAENRLTEVNNTGGLRIATYKYDFSGRRTRKVVNGGQTTVFCYDGDRIITDYDEAGQKQSSYIFGPGIDEPINMERERNWHWYHYDGLGSVIALSFENVQIIETYTYDVYGKPTIKGLNGEVLTESAFGNRFMFTGREFDVETGNYYYRARYYSPKLGRFLQTDPIGYVGGLNLYTYCGNNPLNWVDPYGLRTRNSSGGWDYDYQETERILRTGRERGVYMPPFCNAGGWHEGLHFFPPWFMYGYDYKGWRMARNEEINTIRRKLGLKPIEPSNTYTVRRNGKDTRMRDDQFGNYTAGYLTQYHRGTVQHVHFAGDIEAGGKDDPGSIEYIEMGAADAQAYKEKTSENN